MLLLDAKKASCGWLRNQLLTYPSPFPSKIRGPEFSLHQYKSRTALGKSEQVFYLLGAKLIYKVQLLHVLCSIFPKSPKLQSVARKPSHLQTDFAMLPLL